MTDPLETFWDAILSREPAKICAAYRTTTAQERKDTWRHLQKMRSETGWHPQQQVSAQLALETIQKFFGLPDEHA